MAPSRDDRYRALYVRFGAQCARKLIDELQVLALTDPDTLREVEKFLDRGGTLRLSVADCPDAGRPTDPDIDRSR